MVWNNEQIKNDWFCSGVPLSPETLVETFDHVERVLGRNWLETSRRSREGGAISRGVAPTMRIATLGQRLALLHEVKGPVEKLIERIRQGEASAEAELTAICLLRTREPMAKIEIFPRTETHELDFRVCIGDALGPMLRLHKRMCLEKSKQLGMS